MYCQPVGRVALHHVGRHVGPQNAVTVVDVETGLNTDFEIKVPYRRTESTADVTWSRARWMMSNTVSDGYYSRSLMLAEHVPGVVGRLRRN